MKLYLVMVEDRHTDPAAFVFSTPEAAIEDAKRRAREYAYNQADIDESNPPDGWLYRARYSVEGDCVWVVERTLNDPGED